MKKSKKSESMEPLSQKLKRMMSQPTTEEVPKLPAARNDDMMDADLFKRRKKKSSSY